MTDARPILVDLFCSAGGASAGYERAGFRVIGVDLLRQPHYPFAFVQMDALEFLRLLLDGGAIDVPEFGRLTLAMVAAFAASPPCQAYSVTRHTHSNTHPELVEPTRALLIATGLPYIIENVPGAPLLDPLILCGSEFGLRAQDVDGSWLALRRHRLFESNVWLMGAGGCAHDSTPVAGVYGGGSSSRRRAATRRGGYVPVARVARALLGIDWMNRDELTQAIPPAYTEHLGQQLIAHVATLAEAPAVSRAG